METVELGWETPEIAVVTMRRPEAANAVNVRLATELREAAEEVGFSDDAKVLIVTGSGRHFCAGADLRELDGRRLVWRLREAVDYLAAMEQIVIAAINGSSMGGGTELALACDLRVAARSTKIGLPEVTFGSLPAAGGPQRLARLVGPSRAKYLVCSGVALSGEEAAMMGVVDVVADDGKVRQRAVALAEELALHAGYGLKTAKAVIDHGLNVPLETALRVEYDAIDHMATPEQRQAEIKQAIERSATYAKIFKESPAR